MQNHHNPLGGRPEKQVENLETHTIQPIGLDNRHGTYRDLFTIWFGVNLTVLTIFTGSLTYSLFNLPFVTAVISLLIGHFVGAIFMALHAAQGPQLGVPQMLQTRSQFGSFGSLFVVGLVVLMHSGFFASNAVLGGQTINVISPNIPTNVGITLVAVASLIAAIFGYKIIHMYARLISVVSGIAMLAIFVLILFKGQLPSDFFARGENSMVGIMGTISIGALWQLAYAPYVSDYTRYMPKDTGVKAAFWASYWGCTLGSVLPMILGIIIAIGYTGDITQGMLALSQNSPIAVVAIIAFSIAIAGSNSMNMYCASMSAITCAQTIAPRFNPTSRARAITCLILFAITLSVSILGKDNFLVNYSNFIMVLLYVLVPWTAINLVDYYLVEHGVYDVNSFFRRDGGIYGYFNWAAMVSYVFGILVQIPFMATVLYTGPVAESMGGADISWIVGLVLVSPVYYALIKMKKKQDAAKARTRVQAQA